MSWTTSCVAKTLHVTPTGRSKKIGQTYRRAGGRVKYAKADSPLPMHLQCHPQRLDRTPVNPECVTNSSQYNVSQWGELDWAGFKRGAGLWDAPEPGDWSVVEPITGETIGWCLCSEALSYRNAAARMGATLEVYDNV